MGKQASGTGSGLRHKVRAMTARALRGRPEPGRISSVVTEVLKGASRGVKSATGKTRTSALRQVFHGLNDAVETVTGAGARAARSIRRRGRLIAQHEGRTAARRVRSAGDEFLGAVSAFARRASGDARAELQSLVRRARRTGSAAIGSVRTAARAADGHGLELAGEAARAGYAGARGGLGALAQATSGLLAGIADAVEPRAKRGSARAKPVRKKRRATGRKRTKSGTR